MRIILVVPANLLDIVAKQRNLAVSDSKSRVFNFVKKTSGYTNARQLQKRFNN